MQLGAVNGGVLACEVEAECDWFDTWASVVAAGHAVATSMLVFESAIGGSVLIAKANQTPVVPSGACCGSSEIVESQCSGCSWKDPSTAQDGRLFLVIIT